MKKLTPDPSTRHPGFNRHQHVVQTCYDAFNGEVRDPKYVAKLTEQSDAAYRAMVDRPFYLNATERAVQGLIGIIMRTPPQVFGGEINVHGSASFEAFVQDQIMDVALGGRILITVNVDDFGKPYLEYFTAQNIINWSDTFVMLESTEYVPDEHNPYELVPVTYWKEYFVDENGNHAARYWYKKDGQFVPTEPVNLLVNGNPVPGLQVWYVTPYDNTTELYNPPVKSISELNVAHFRLSCDHYHGLHYLAVPTFTVVGSLMPDENGQTSRRIILGSTTEALHLAEGGSASFVEFSGSGLGSIHEEKNRVEELMADYSLRLLSPKAGVETAEAVQLRADIESTSIGTMVNALENGLNGALELYSLISGTQTYVELNRDLMMDPTDPNPIDKDTEDLWAARIAGNRGTRVDYWMSVHKMTREQAVAKVAEVVALNAAQAPQRSAPVVHSVTV